MRILHVVASYLPAHRYGGTIVSVHGLAAAQAARGHDVEVFTTSVDGPADSAVPHGQRVDRDGVGVWYFRSRWLRRIYWSPALGRALDQRIGGFDIVHIHAVFLWPLWRAARAAARAGVPYFISPRGMLEQGLIEKRSTLLKSIWIALVERRNLKQATAVHVTSRRESDELTRLGWELPAIVDVPNGVEPPPVPAPGLSPELAARVGAGPFALFLGRLEWKKGIERLIDALPLAPQVRVVVAGNDEHGYQQVLEERAGEQNVRDRVRFVGPVFGADKWALLSASTLLVLPSYSENFGNVVLEAMACGRPVIVTEEVGLASLVRESQVGVVVDGAPASMAAALTRLMTDAGESAAMGERARAVAARYSWPAVAETMERAYQDARATSIA